MELKPLAGVGIWWDGDGVAVETCVRHLVRLGATAVDSMKEAEVLLVSPTGARRRRPRGTLRCEFEHHHLLGGGLVGSEATTQAALGLTDYIGPAGGRPARTGADVASACAGFCAAQAIVASLYAGQRSASIRVSPLRALSALKTILWAARSRPDEWSGTHVRSRERLVDAGYGTLDRRITLDFPYGAGEQWLGFVQELGLDAGAVERLRARWYESVGWGDDVDDARGLYDERLERLTSEEAISLIRRHGGSSVPFQTPAECLVHPQSVAIGLPDALAHGMPWAWDSPEGDGYPAGGGLDSMVEPVHSRGGPLTGVRVVDFGVGGVGPFGATLLGWLGADVVKVEAPNEFILTVRPTAGGISTTYLALNQGKRSVALDLKNARDHELARALVEQADVVVENFRPGALDRLGFGFSDVASVNPRIVYCSATGFGSRGPLANEICTDPHMQAFSGFAQLNADESGVPRRVRYYGFVDLVTSCVIAEAICAGLLARRRSGGPIRIETSMLQAVSEAQQSAVEGPRLVPDDVFQAADGYVAITCLDSSQRDRLVELLGLPRSFASPNPTTVARPEADATRFRASIEQILTSRPAAAWVHLLEQAGIPCVRVLHDEDVLTRKDFWTGGVLRELPLRHAAPLVAGGPPWFLGLHVRAPMAPLPGGDTESLRQEGKIWVSGEHPSRAT